MGAVIDKFLVLGMGISIITLALSIYGISTQEDIDKCGSNYVASVAFASISTGAILALLFITLIRINNLCPFTTYLPNPQVFSSPQLSPEAYSQLLP